MENKQKSVLRGLATISIFADNLQEAKKWYSDFLEIEPYYLFPDAENPAYIEFRLGDFEHELGIIDKKFQPASPNSQPGGVVAFWHVDDVESVFAKLLAHGAMEYEKITEREDGFITASVVDPFGNILGIMYNPHYLEILNSLNK
ncbi:VOC family protein [Dyadobacter sp. CY345]|uniref:VOC family protein n=1 Tax=Dyadobacter sp. CY345 TaxID=2909335 RepID=UPI001F27277A|nr:VOC family protein [Dyadobacter sp. CY345]MCF2443438.1 VOC family protein [Dyadobacter sp. CY345]